MDILSQIQAARVTNPTQAQVFPFVLYDSLCYNTAGTTQLSFFQSPIGQGITSAPGATVGTPKTYADTNMNLAGQLPSGMEFLIKSVEVAFDPGRDTTVNSFLPAILQTSNSGDVSAVVAGITDTQEVLSAGWLELNILQQNYLRDAPLLNFPTKVQRKLMGSGAATTVAASSFVSGLLNAEGRPWYVDGEALPGISIQPATNFEVLIKFPGAIAVTNTARMRVRLDGYVVRSSQ